MMGKLQVLPKKGRIMRLRSVSSGIKPEFPLCAAQHGLFSHILLSFRKPKKGHIMRVLMVILLVAALLFSQGCLTDIVPEEVPLESDIPAEIQTTDDETSSNAPSRGRFTLRFDPQSTLNPITGQNSDNILLSSLMYECLFSLDGALNAEPVLCERWHTGDNVTYTFEIKPNVAMSDGSLLTADDVAYTLNQAMRNARFSRRLGNIKSIATDGELTLTVELKSPNRRFINLLDVPVIKSDSIGNNLPPGTGPYVLAGAEAVRLNRFAQHRDFSRLPVTIIYLRECGDDEVAEMFEDGKLSLLWDDPSDTYDIRLNRIRETRPYDTTALQFIGFNTRLTALAEPDVRRAIGCAIDRDYITNEIMQGQAQKAPLALSPSYAFYDERWENTAVDPLGKIMSDLLLRAGLADIDNDSFFEYPDGFWEYRKFSIDFIVNSENTYKVRIVHEIADKLRRTGFDIAVRELPWAGFIEALESGSFDMFYGETELNADFDLSSLLLPNGSLNYGGTGGSSYAPLIESFLSASTDAGEKAAAERLCDEIKQFAPFVPVLYKKYVVYTPIGAISGASPGQSGVFRMFPDWTVDLTMLS
ncbi:MAG: ABC transporter substrate-binding protein [Oscillospiraceae bacterium]|jgi:peptide/nickel transport system substrate-binding protein|nr:ABC transporter substrate-binding protein [Oscillospiraceae bacterium]